ncbi:unnamed protein product, partial [marine sediment metagenome]
LESKDASKETLRELFIPAVSSLITDGIGFMSLMIIPLLMIKGMAIASGAGVLSIFFTVVIFIPAMLSYMPKPRRIEIEREDAPTLVNRMMAGIAHVVERKRSRWIIVALFLVLALLGIKGASQLVVGDNEIGSSILYPDSRYNVAERVVNDNFSGSNPYYVFVKGKEQECLVDSSALKEMGALQRHLSEKVPEVGYSLSLVDYVKGLNSAMFGGERRYFAVPEDNRTIAEYLFLYSISSFPGDFDPVVSRNYQFANLKFDLKD